MWHIWGLFNIWLKLWNTMLLSVSVWNMLYITWYDFKQWFLHILLHCNKIVDWTEMLLLCSVAVCVAEETGGGAEWQDNLCQCWSQGRHWAVAYKQTERLSKTFCEYGRPTDLLLAEGLDNFAHSLILNVSIRLAVQLCIYVGPYLLENVKTAFYCFWTCVPNTQLQASIVVCWYHSQAVGWRDSRPDKLTR